MKYGLFLLLIVLSAGAVMSEQANAQEKVVMVAPSAPQAVPSYGDMMKLVISPRSKYFQMKPGGEEEFTVKVKNREKEEVILSPRLELLPYAEYPLEEGWVSIAPVEATLQPGKEQVFTIKIAIPLSADIGRYNAMIAFTNETLATTGFPMKVNSINLGINVWKPPIVKIPRKYIRDRVEAGKSYTYEIKLENTGGEGIALSPKFGGSRIGGCMGMGCPKELEAAWVSIASPSKVEANSKATVTVSVSMPASAKGVYEGVISLGISDPSLREWDQQVRLNLVVWQQPTKPYEKGFKVRGGSSRMSIEVGVNQYAYDKFGSANGEEPSFAVTLVSPGGEEFSPAPNKTTVSSVINLGSGYLPPWEEEGSGLYRVERVNYKETFVLEEPVAGQWLLKVLPSNAAKFEYTIEVE